MKSCFSVVLAALALAGCATQPPQQTDGILPAGCFRYLSLPKVDELLSIDGPIGMPVSIGPTGEISIGVNGADLSSLGGIIFKGLADSTRARQPPFHVNIGADDNTPFDRVWPVLLTCCAKGLWKVGLAISAGHQDYMNVLNVYLPTTGTNAPYPSPLVFKADAEFTVISVQTNGLAVAHLKRGLVTGRKWLGHEPFPGCMHEEHIPPLRGIDVNLMVAIVPSQGVSYGDVARVVYWCRRFGQKSISIVREDAIPSLHDIKE